MERLIRRLPRASTLDEIRALLRPTSLVTSETAAHAPVTRQIRLPRAAPLIVVGAGRPRAIDA